MHKTAFFNNKLCIATNIIIRNVITTIFHSVLVFAIDYFYPQQLFAISTFAKCKKPNNYFHSSINNFFCKHISLLPLHILKYYNLIAFFHTESPSKTQHSVR